MNVYRENILSIWKNNQLMELAIYVIKNTIDIEPFRNDDKITIPLSIWTEATGITAYDLPHEFGNTTLRDGSRFPLLFDGFIYVYQLGNEEVVSIIVD